LTNFAKSYNNEEDKTGNCYSEKQAPRPNEKVSTGMPLQFATSTNWHTVVDQCEREETISQSDIPASNGN
jgi:hypothetical protein